MKAVTFVALLICFQFSCAAEQQQRGAQADVMNAVSNQAVFNVQKAGETSTDDTLESGQDVDPFAHFKPEHREIVRGWLETRIHLRPAVEEIDSGIFHEANYADKENFKRDFDGNMKMLRESVGERGYQYYSVGDMNQDKKEDFAVLLVDNRKREDEADSFVLAIFNAPFRKGQSPSYYEENLRGISNSYIAFNTVEEKHLFLGKFESGVYCATYYPKGKTYLFKDCWADED